MTPSAAEAKMAEPTENRFSTIFNSSRSKTSKIEMAVALLRVMLDKPENPPLAAAWANALQTFGDDQLASSFAAAALTSKGWPTLSDITEPILEAEYASDFSWLIAGLRKHGAEWRERPAIYGDRYHKPGAGMDDWEDGPLKEPAVPAPDIPLRLREVLARIGAGQHAAGLAELNRHPLANGYYADSGEAARTRVAIEREFHTAWMAVRKREVVGSN